MEKLYHIICIVFRSIERWKNKRGAGSKQYVTRFERFKTNKSRKNNLYNELQLVTKKGKKNESVFNYKPNQQKMKTLKITLFALLMPAANIVCAQGLESKTAGSKSAIEKNKEAVIRFDKEYWEIGEVEIAKQLLADNYVKHFAAPNGPNGSSLMVPFIQSFKKGFSDVAIEFHEVSGEGDKVSLTEKITATHTGDFMGKAATGKKVVINIVEIDRLKDGKITETWSLSDLPQVIQSI